MSPADVTLPPRWGSDDEVLLRWLAADGAAVTAAEPVCELEAAKATADVVSPADGTLRHLVGDGPVAAGTTLGRVYSAAESVPPPTVAPAPARPRRATTRKRAEIHALVAGRSGTLPSTVMTQAPIGLLADRLREDGASLTALVVHEAARMLRAHPAFNARVGRDGTIPADRIRIGVALDVEPHGLKVAIIDDADTKTLDTIAGDLQVLLYRYLTKAFAPEDLRGATFTVTDLSGFGATWSVPLLVRDQTAILGIGSAGAVFGRTLTLALTFDHRAASGREAATFLQGIATKVTARAADVPPVCARCGRASDPGDPMRAHLVAVVTAAGSPELLCRECWDAGGP